MHLRRLPSAGVDVFAVDGTLLNLLRWGRVVNDNDIDVLVIARAVSPQLGNASAHYLAAVDALADIDFIDRPSARERRKLYHPFKPVKPRRCRARKGFMQCRHGNGVLVDVFGPDAVLTPLTGLRRDDFVPPVACRAFRATFPCPASPVRALKQWTLDFGEDLSATASPGSDRPSGGQRRTWFEFGGCSLLPKKPEEQSLAHVRSIVHSGRQLKACGFPHLLGDLHEVACAAALRDAGAL